MNFNNELYVFNDVPGYDASKGERIVKALHKFWIKIAKLEQVRLLEKKALSKEVQTTNDADLTFADVQVELLRTQLHYLIKIAREYSNDKFKLSFESKKETQNSQINPSNKSSVRDVLDHSSHLKSHEVENSTSVGCQDNFLTENTGEKKIYLKKCETTDSSMKLSASASNSAVPHMHPKVNSHHYHLKLNDVPFILGASSSASHSVVANVQNIIAMMKMHNKALCASKPQVRQNAPSIPNKACAQNANEMLQELSEDLSKLTMKQQKLKQIFDNAQATQLNEKTKIEMDGAFNTKVYIKNKESSACGQNAAASKASEKPMNELKEKTENKNHLIPTNKKKNNYSHLARLKMLRSLQDFKAHLSEEEISWN